MMTKARKWRFGGNKIKELTVQKLRAKWLEIKVIWPVHVCMRELYMFRVELYSNVQLCALATSENSGLISKVVSLGLDGFGVRTRRSAFECDVRRSNATLGAQNATFGVQNAKISNGRLPPEDGSDQAQTLPKRVSDDSLRFIFRRQKIFLTTFFKDFWRSRQNFEHDILVLEKLGFFKRHQQIRIEK